MFEKTIDFIAQYLSGFVIVLVALAVFLGCLFVTSLDSHRNDPQISQRTELCWLLRSENCF